MRQEMVFYSDADIPAEIEKLRTQLGHAQAQLGAMWVAVGFALLFAVAAAWWSLG